jgi:hypothetical protein
MQANGAEMMRIAAMLATEAGITVCAPIHDAFLIEADLADLESAVAEMREVMAEASRKVLNGFEIRTDVEIIRYPDRYRDERGAQMWRIAIEQLERIEAAATWADALVRSHLRVDAAPPARRRGAVSFY